MGTYVCFKYAYAAWRQTFQHLIVNAFKLCPSKSTFADARLIGNQNYVKIMVGQVSKCCERVRKQLNLGRAVDTFVGGLYNHRPITI